MLFPFENFQWQKTVLFCKCFDLRKKELISPMKNIPITAQYIALERTDAAIDAHFAVYPRVEYK